MKPKVQVFRQFEHLLHKPHTFVFATRKADKNRYADQRSMDFPEPKLSNDLMHGINSSARLRDYFCWQLA